MKSLGPWFAACALAVAGCGNNRPPPCLGEACRSWPHVELRFHRNREGRAYTGALCVQVSFDCPEEGRHGVWIEPEQIHDVAAFEDLFAHERVEG